MENQIAIDHCPNRVDSFMRFLFSFSLFYVLSSCRFGPNPV